MRIRLTILLLFCSGLLHAQVKVVGKMLHFTTQKELRVSQVNVINIDTDERYSLVSSNGKYKVKLDLGARYKVEYTKDGYYNKFLMVDTRGIPSGKSLTLYVDMDMIEITPGLDGALFNDAMGIATYQADIKQMGWNLDYSKKRFEEVNAAFEKLSEDQDETNHVPKEEDKDETLLNTEVDEPYVMTLSTPFQITYKFRSLLDPESFSVPSNPISFKESLLCGMIFSQLAMHADDDGTDKRIGMVREFEKISEVPFNTKEFQIRLANAAGKQDSIDHVLADLYYSYQNACSLVEENTLIEKGSYLEILYQVVSIYPDKANQDLNTFLGTAPEYMEVLLSAENELASDAELSFNSDFQKLNNILQKIEYKPGGEMIQSDMLQTPHYFNVTPEILHELKESLTQIRSNLL